MKTIRQTATKLLIILGIFITTMSSCSKNPIPNPASDLVINVKTPGTLWKEIRKTGIDSLQIDKMTLLGTLNSTDVLCLRHMTGSGKIDTETTKGKLSNLDISKVKFIQDTTTYCINSDDRNRAYKIDSPDSLPGSIFINCHSLKSISIPTSITSIGQYAFRHCSSLEDIQMPNNIKKIGTISFAECPSLRSIVIPESVTSIGYAAYSYCSSLNNVTMYKIDPSNMYLGQFIFYGIPQNAILHVPANVIDKYKAIKQFTDVFGSNIIPIK